MSRKEQASDKMKRRSFLRKIWVGVGIVAGLELIYIAMNFFKPRKSIANKTITNYFEAGSIEQFKNNSITSYRNRSFFLCRLKDGEFIALSSKCTHLGCALTCNTEKNLLECPCHSSMFNIEGEVLRSPATRNLERHEVIIEKGIIKVNTSSIIASSVSSQNISSIS